MFDGRRKIHQGPWCLVDGWRCVKENSPSTRGGARAAPATPRQIPAGSSILLLHPSTGKTDQIDTSFLKTDVDAILIISTRTTAREVKQKLEHYGVDQDTAQILDTLSVERGYSRRQSDGIHYVSSPDDLAGIVKKTGEFLESTNGKRRISVDSVTEMAYYASENDAKKAVKSIIELLEEHDAIGLFHLSPEVHDSAIVSEYKEMFYGIVELAEDGSVTTQFP
jgi:KaiC/GvpD/RAD55 family RecA-like ATPase